MADRVDDFVSLLEDVGHQGLMGLLEVPRTTVVGVAQLRDHLDQIVHGVAHGGRSRNL